MYRFHTLDQRKDSAYIYSLSASVYISGKAQVPVVELLHIYHCTMDTPHQYHSVVLNNYFTNCEKLLCMAVSGA